MQTREHEIGKAAAYLPPGEGSRHLWVFGELVMYKTKSQRTGGAYSLFEVVSPPGGGPPPHVQHREDESYYLLEGEYEFLVEGRTFMASAGSLIYIPRGTLHAHKTVGEETGRYLLSQTPGGLHEQFFEDIGKPTMDNSQPPVQTDLEKIMTIATEYGIEIPSPDLSSGGEEEITE